MFAITSNPPAVCLSGLPMNFTVASDRIEDNYKILALPIISGSPAELLSLNAAANAEFELSEYFLNERVTEYSDAATWIHTNACKNSTIAFQEYYGNPPSGSNQITWTGLIMGGRIPRWKHYELIASYATFYEYLVAIKPFLTWYPRTGKKVLPGQPERLYWYNHLTENPVTIALVCGIFFDDNTFDLYDPSVELTTNPQRVVSFATGPDQLGIDTWATANHPGKTVQQYYVQVTKTGVGVSDVFLYNIDRDNYRSVRYLIFRNSLVGYDCLACTGEADEFTDIERFTSERVADINDANRLHKREYRNEASEKVKINTGWLQKNDQNWLNELFLSPEIYEVSGSQRIRILLTSKQLDRSRRIFEQSSVEIEYERLFPAE
jgi:hypothetical protein